MPQFSYKARKRSGELVEGVLEVMDRPAAVAQIERQGLFPISVDSGKTVAPGAQRAGQRTDWMSLLPPTLRAQLQKKRKPKLQELATFTQQLANLLQSGMPLSTALNSMTYLETKGIESEVSRNLKQEVTEGRSLSDAMAQNPRVFSELYVNMVKAGEQSGALVDVLRRMADHFEKFAQLQSKVTSALVYPAIVITVGIGMIVFFLSFVLPKFISIFASSGDSAQLPAITQVLISISHAFQHFWWLMGIVALLVIVLFKRFQTTDAGRRAIDKWKMKAPIIGKVVCLNLYGQFARTLCTLLKNGVPVLTALKITEQVIPNVIIKEATARTRDAVTDGKSLAQPLAASKVFPRLMVDLVKIGEETGNVSDALNNVAETYENELNLALRVMMNVIEPVLIIGMAVIVGFLLAAVLDAMFSMVSNIGNSMGSGSGGS